MFQIYLYVSWKNNFGAISWVLTTHLVHTKLCSGPKMYGWGQNNEYSCHRINSTWKPFKVGFYLVTCMLFLKTILRITSYKIRPPKLLWMRLDEVIQLTIAMELIWLEYHWIWWISFSDLNTIFGSAAFCTKFDRIGIPTTREWEIESLPFFLVITFKITLFICKRSNICLFFFHLFYHIKRWM